MEEKNTAAPYGKVRWDPKDRGRFELTGELDHHSVRIVREIIDEKLIEYRPQTVVLDLSGVSFADSAGLGLILGRYTRIKDYGGELLLTGVSRELMKILRLAGAERFLKIETASKGKTKVTA